MRAWIVLVFLLFPFDGGTEENKEFLPTPATLDGKEGETLSELLYKRENTIDEWDAEELKHLQTIKKIFQEPQNVPRQPSIIADYNDKNYQGPRDSSDPVTLSELVSSGVGMLVNHRISDVKKTKRNNNNNKYKRIVNDKHNEDIREALHMVSSSSSDGDSGDDDEDDGISSSFVLFLIALFPALIGLLILGTFVVLLFLEVVNRTRPQPLQYGGYMVDDTEEGAIYEDFLPQDYEKVMDPVVRKPLKNIRGKRIKQNNKRRPRRTNRRPNNRERLYYG